LLIAAMRYALGTYEALLYLIRSHIFTCT